MCSESGSVVENDGKETMDEEGDCRGRLGGGEFDG